MGIHNHLLNKIKDYDYESLKIASKRNGYFGWFIGLSFIFYIFGYDLNNLGLILFQIIFIILMSLNVYKIFRQYKKILLPRHVKIFDIIFISYHFLTTIVFPIICVKPIYENGKYKTIVYNYFILYFINIIICFFVIYYLNKISKKYIWKKVS